jgi:hypothetical protein
MKLKTAQGYWRTDYLRKIKSRAVGSSYGGFIMFPPVFILTYCPPCFTMALLVSKLFIVNFKKGESYENYNSTRR